MLIQPILTLALAAGAVAAAPDAEPLPGNAHVAAGLVLDRTALVPGGEALLGVTFTIAKPWHLYWRNAGDSGVPIDISLELPEGVTAGEPVWPAPERHIAAGGLLDYIYEQEVTIVYPLTIGDGVEVGKEVEVGAEVEFLVCDEICIPGRSSVHRSFGVASTDSAADDAGAIDRAKARWATPLKDLPEGTVATGWDGTTLTISAPRATELTFYPYETPADRSSKPIEPSDPIETCRVEGDRLALVYPAELPRLEVVRGVLELARGPETLLILIEVETPKD